MRNAGMDEAQTEIKLAGRNINNSDMQMTPPLWLLCSHKKTKRTKNLPDESERGE